MFGRDTYRAATARLLGASATVGLSMMSTSSNTEAALPRGCAMP